MFLLAKKVKNELSLTDDKIKGFNIGFNESSSLGQSLSHAHLHVIPRRAGGGAKAARAEFAQSYPRASRVLNFLDQNFYFLVLIAKIYFSFQTDGSRFPSVC